METKIFNLEIQILKQVIWKLQIGLKDYRISSISHNVSMGMRFSSFTFHWTHKLCKCHIKLQLGALISGQIKDFRDFYKCLGVPNPLLTLNPCVLSSFLPMTTFSHLSHLKFLSSPLLLMCCSKNSVTNPKIVQIAMMKK